MSDVGIVILAAGGSLRMGRPKQLLPIAGQSMLRRAARSATESGCRPIVVVLGARPDLVQNELAGLPVDVTINDAWQRGIGSSIRCGIDALAGSPTPPRAAFIMLCDQPLVGPEVIRRLLTAKTRSGRPICVSGYADSFGPPVVVDSQYFDLLLALPDDQGAKAIWASRAAEVHFEPCLEGAIDIDTAADYERWAPRFASDILHPFFVFPPASKPPT